MQDVRGHHVQRDDAQCSGSRLLMAPTRAWGRQLATQRGKLCRKQNNAKAPRRRRRVRFYCSQETRPVETRNIESSASISLWMRAGNPASVVFHYSVPIASRRRTLFLLLRWNCRCPYSSLLALPVLALFRCLFVLPRWSTASDCRRHLSTVLSMRSSRFCHP